MTNLVSNFTSTGSKLFYHQEAMQALRDGSGKPIHAWLAAHDICNHRCSFCSVGERAGDVLSFNVIKPYFETLTELGLKAVTLSGGGNSILYKCQETGADFNDLVDFLYGLGLQIGVITNGMPLKEYGEFNDKWYGKDLGGITTRVRKSWRSVNPSTLDKMTWCRISMSGIDHNHKEQEVFVPDFDPSKTTLGFSWIMSDSYEEPTHKHGWVSTPEDTRGFKREVHVGMANDIRPWPPCPQCGSREYGWYAEQAGIRHCPYCSTKFTQDGRRVILATDRLPFIEEKIRGYVEKHKPGYVRLLSNCLQPDLIPERHRMLTEMAARIDPQIVFSQNKPPRQPGKCWKVLPHPCLNADGWVYPCDSVVLNRDANHQFGSKWRICKAEQVRELYQNPKAFNMPDGICPGCVFADQVDLIGQIVAGMETPMPAEAGEHVNFV